MPSIGQQLSFARKARDLTAEDVAFHTRIPAARVRDMENDDLSRFANLTYARGFLKIYSRFLEVDISDYLSQFSSEDLATASGHEYVQTANATHNLPPAVFTDQGRARSPGLYILILAGLAGAGVFWWSNRGTNSESQSQGQRPSPEAEVKKSPAPLPVPVPAPAPPPEASPAKPPKATVVEEVDDEPKPE
ncbi:MAG TPA: helix-turn-helix domain-containing protein [Verrucomicrobiales bacterium]|nr:helix-turn-helix domain-containing protein [Verrucomicrobiales bacterium]